MDDSRRRSLAIAGLTPFALTFRSTARAAEPAICSNPATLPLAQKRQRRAVGYVEVSTDAVKHCGRCAFFTPNATAESCGTCQLLTGGPVAAIAVCNSFAPKPGKK